MIMGKNFEVAIGLSKLHLIKKKSFWRYSCFDHLPLCLLDVTPVVKNMKWPTANEFDLKVSVESMYLVILIKFYCVIELSPLPNLYLCAMV